ncbi:MAG: hypothetical protein LQ342_004464 [Letrouitia transgressa]|nr:MAG: hypothetical protein LQ342_004464 [Letrouitia transgressa]
MGDVENTSKIYGALQQGMTRLLVLRPAISSSHPLKADLIPINLHAASTYEALSYTWGDETIRKPITLCRQPFSIRENLDAALRSLRYSFKDRVLWIDAICINQSDEAEKSQQVLQMKNIYEKARQVIIWLGELGDGGRAGLQLVKNPILGGMGSSSWKQNRELGDPVLQNFSSSWSSSIAIQRTAENSLESQYGYLSEILERPWWTRAWIIQEVTVASKAVVRCGPDEVSFKQILERVRKPEPIDVKFDEDNDAPSQYQFPDGDASLLHELHTQWQARTFKKSLYELLYAFRRYGCTNPRDRVYAFLGLASDAESVGIIPNYDASPSDVYTSFAKAMIASHQHLQILNLKREFYTDKPSDMPSKVYGLIDQSKFHDTDATIVDKPGTKPRKGWAQLPNGWQRSVRDGKIGFVDHGSGIFQISSPLDKGDIFSTQSINRQRMLPPGWIKSWDNLGRTKFLYAPDQTLESKEPRIRVPIWVPNWDQYSIKDPEPLLNWPNEGQPQFWACGKSSTVQLESDPRSHALRLKGINFDEIELLTPAWHPEASAYPYPPSRKGQLVLEMWEGLALQQPAIGCPYQARGASREEAMWRTHLADPPHELAAPATDRAYFDVWRDRIGWCPEVPDPDVPTTVWERATAMVNAKNLGQPAYKYFLDLTQDEPGFRNMFAHERAFRQTYRRVRERIYRVCRNRALFVTARGYVGLAPWNVEVGDRVCVLYGGATPFLLRRVEGKDDFGLVGECYVYGIMGGEALQLRGGNSSTTFNLV